MKILAIAALAAASLAQAQPHPSYRSVFEDTPRGVETRRDDWKKANAEVGRFPRGHADWLKWEEAQGAQSPRAPASAASGR